MALYKYPSSSRSNAPAPTGITEFEILKASHKFLRDEDEKPTTWDEQLAGKYYESLYREFAVCDLKHYKSGNFALRWRTEDEVLSGAGETTCGNTRCEHHVSTRFQNEGGSRVSLTTLELPFAYLEHGESKSALVKVVLCGRCMKKLMWKRTKEKEREMSALIRDSRLPGDEESKDTRERSHEEEEEIEKQRRKKRSREEKEEKEGSSRKRASSRSRSPRRQKGNR
ncbi:hypothetical protein M413DRAFT_164146 [Hebeloma cylindrosporum]|uniref:Protein FRA10AC1 n=1 Tax=Hebeloma cylindrosporum TaxID=76867 RepID=A0A0C2YHN0_HEBCY|nr:hypothetical protein M413DRAFT_164146 [Hebeloma cylindrosporum h7]